jgi:ribokinase
MKSKLAVIGSINMDVVNRVEHHPLPGETIHGLETSYIAGGKGANQAVAAARNGAGVVMVGAVGDDPFGAPLLEALQAGGVDNTQVCRKPGTSGMAFITVNQEGENNIILSTGANGKLGTKDVEDALARIGVVNAVLLQNEIPWETTVHAIQAARKAGASVYLNPAPAREVADDVLALIDVLVVNETEAHVLSGVPVHKEADAKAAANALIGRGVREVIVTLGAAGACYFHQNGESERVLAHQVEAVDTTAAGDTFIGVYVANRESGVPNSEALKLANAAAALAVTKRGAQSSIPDGEEVRQWLSGRSRNGG